MSGVEALRARIDKLSTEIDMQTELLKKLRHDKSLVQRQLNAVLDPVARLPVEISSEIFLQSLPILIEPDARHAPMLLLNICNSWTSIALSTPGLWAVINIDFPCTEGFKKVLPIWLRRGGNHPLSLSLHGTFDRGIAATIWRHGSRLKHLEIREEEDNDDEDTTEELGAEPMDLLGGMSPGPLPLLETLRIRGVPWRRGFPGPQILELLRQAPNLVKCSFERMCPVHNLDPTAEKLVHPTLRRLMFAESNYNDILHCLSLPALKTISLSLSETSIGDFIYFLSRSSPLLEELTVVTGASLDSVRLRLYECLRIVPTVACFEIWWPGSRLLEGLFNGLADSSSPVLPNLHSLIIHLHVYAVSDSSWKTLLGVLSARRTQLQIIHIKYSETVSQRPAPDVFAAFRELVASGMQVHIGTEAYNWLSV